MVEHEKHEQIHRAMNQKQQVRHTRYFPRASHRFLALLVATVFLGSCTGAAQTIIVQLAIRAFAQLAVQQVAALAAHNDASIAMASAQVQVNLEFESPQTQAFIDKWRKAGEETRTLRQRFEAAQSASADLVSFLNTKADTIQDAALRQRSRDLIAQRQERFVTALADTDKAISSLEASVATGNDIVTALEIAGALGGFDDQIVSLQRQTHNMVERLPQMSRMVEQGMALVDLEFSALGEVSS